MSFNESAKPLWMQSKEAKEAAKNASPSFESFGPHVKHHSNNGIKEMEGHVHTNDINRVRRYPNGQIDYQYVVSQLIQAVKQLTDTGMVQPLEGALLTIVMPDKFRFMDPAMAKIRTQISDTERDQLKTLFMGKMAEIQNWNGGYGGGSTPGKTITFNL